MAKTRADLDVLRDELVADMETANNMVVSTRYKSLSDAFMYSRLNVFIQSLDEIRGAAIDLLVEFEKKLENDGVFPMEDCEIENISAVKRYPFDNTPKPGYETLECKACHKHYIAHTGIYGNCHNCAMKKVEEYESWKAMAD